MPPARGHDPSLPHNARQHMPRDSADNCEKKKSKEVSKLIVNQVKYRATKYLSVLARSCLA